MFSHLTGVARPTCTLGAIGGCGPALGPARIRREHTVPWGDESSASRLGGAAQGADDR